MKCKGILNFVLIGAKNSGKTTYLSSLSEDADNSIRGREDATVSHLDNIRKSIKENGKPESTSGTLKTLCFTYTQPESGRVNFEIDDYDGQFAQTISELVDETKAERVKLKENVRRSEGCIFLIPYENSSDELEKFTREIDRFVELAEFDTHNKSPIPAIIMVTKWDNNTKGFEAGDEEEQARKYLESNVDLKRVKKAIEDNFENTIIIPIASKGKYHNLIKPIDYVLKHTFNHWYNTALQYKNNKEDKKFYSWIKKIYYDTKFNSKFDKFNKELKAYERKNRNVKIGSVLAIAAIVTLGVFYFINLDSKTNHKKWMNETKVCLASSKGEKGLETIDSLIKQTYNNVKFVENSTVDKRLEELNSLKSQISIKLGKEDSATKLKDTTTIQEIIDMTEEAFMMKSVAVRQVESFYPDFFSTKKGISILESLKNSINQNEFEEILDEDVISFIHTKEKFTKILVNIDDARSQNEIKDIKYPGYSNFEDLDKSKIKNNIKNKIDEFIEDIKEKKPINNTLKINEWLTSMNNLKNTEIEQIGYKYKISNTIDDIITETKSKLDKDKKLVTEGIDNISVKIKGHEDNSIGFECSIFGFSDDIIVSGFGQDLKHDKADDCKDDTILFKNKISLKAKKYSIVASEYEFISYFNDSLLPSSIIFTKEDLYKLDKLGSVTKSIDRGRIQLIFDKSSK